MATSTLTIEICGMSGDGTISAGLIMNTVAAKAGLYALAFDSYPAEIRGFGKCVTHGSFSSKPVLTQGDTVDVLISLNDKLSMEQLDLLGPGSVVIYDNAPVREVPEGETLVSKLDPDVHHYGVPFWELSESAMSSDRGRNLVALGAVAALFDLEPEHFKAAIKKKFYKASEKVMAGNLKAFEHGIEYVRENVKKLDTLSFSDLVGDELDVELVSGHQALARACVDHDVRLYAGYPITPATPIMEILAKELPKHNGAVLQMEDEIASIGAVVGAGYGGRRALTATSGPGLSLMSEILNLAVMAEVPAVVINAQRGGPSTGLPTKTEQSDLNLCVYGGAGDSPRIVLAPADVSQCYEQTALAFWLAEKYQTPVIVMVDFFLANRVESVCPLATIEELLDGNVWAKPEEVPEGKRFARYADTESGISPRSIPGMEGLTYPATGIEHNPTGNPDYRESNHAAITDKRWRKIEGALADTPCPTRYGVEKGAKVGVLAWGSTVGAVREAVERAVAEGVSAAALAVPTVWPLHTEELNQFLDEVDTAFCPEGNRWGQFAALVAGKTGKPVGHLGFATGAPIPPKAIFDEIMRRGTK